MKPKNLIYAAILMTCILILFNVCRNANSTNSLVQESEYFKSIPISNKFIDMGEDSYWVDAGDYTQDGKPDIVAYGLGGYDKATGDPVMSPIYLYKNPGVSLNGQMGLWKRQLIGKILTPTGMAHADINKDGKLDIILNDEYGRNIFNCNPQGGNVFWLENPGNCDDDTTDWVRHDIGRTPVQHRIAVGRFTQHNEDEIVTVPVVGKCTKDDTESNTLVYSPIQIKIYEKPENVEHSGEWPETIINDELSLIHDYTLKKNPKLSDYDVLLISSLEGISWLYYGRDKQWHLKRISNGQTDMSDYANTRLKLKGTNTADIGQIGQTTEQYMVSIEPFHGGTLAAYAKNDDKWSRKVLHKYGKPDKSGFSVGHYVITNDFDKDGTDEFLAIFPQPPKGILYGEPKNVSKFGYDTTRIFTETAARVALADFDQDGWDDFATTGYLVRDYYEDEGSRLYIHLNKLGMKKIAKSLNQ